MRIEWEVASGCNRTYTINIPDEEVEGLDERQRDELIDKYVLVDFDSRVGFSWAIVPKCDGG